MQDENKRQYELIFILPPNLEEGAINSFEQEIEKNLEDLGGNLKKKEKPERRTLSYPIKKFQSGYYLTMNFLFNPEKLDELSGVLKHKKDILRYMINFVETPPPIKAQKAKTKKEKPKIEKFKKLTEEVTEEEIEKIKKETARKKEEKKETKLEEIDKKLDEILGI